MEIILCVGQEQIRTAHIGNNNILFLQTIRLINQTSLTQTFILTEIENFTTMKTSKQWQQFPIYSEREVTVRLITYCIEI